MARTAFGITSSAITWEKTKSEISVNETGLVEISVEGAVNSTGITLADALALVPTTLPTTTSGPIGASAEYAGAKLSTKSAGYEDGTWQVRASYTKGGAQTSEFPDGTEQSDQDRYERRIVVQEDPLMSHPVALEFPTKQKNLLANLMRGESIIANPDYNPDEADESKPANWEFGFVDPITGKIASKISFSEEEVTVGEITGTPLQYARLIKASIVTYQRKSVRHSWHTSRNEPAPNTQYRRVGTVVDQPPGAPTLANGFQWMLTGIIDTSSNGETWQTSYEYDASAAGGFLAMLYEGGNQTMDS
jgi:hypothetical protein